MIYIDCKDTLPHVHCEACEYTTSPWPSQDQAELDIAWHYFHSHPTIWLVLIGPYPPGGNDPELVARN